jgi:hypothetical protein
MPLPQTVLQARNDGIPLPSNLEFSDAPFSSSSLTAARKEKAQVEEQRKMHGVFVFFNLVVFFFTGKAD